MLQELRQQVPRAMCTPHFVYCQSCLQKVPPNCLGPRFHQFWVLQPGHLQRCSNCQDTFRALTHSEHRGVLASSTLRTTAQAKLRRTYWEPSFGSEPEGWEGSREASSYLVRLQDQLLLSVLH